MIFATFYQKQILKIPKNVYFLIIKRIIAHGKEKLYRKPTHLMKIDCEDKTPTNVFNSKYINTLHQLGFLALDYKSESFEPIN
jgi:hypothetical protein